MFTRIPKRRKPVPPIVTPAPRADLEHEALIHHDGRRTCVFCQRPEDACVLNPCADRLKLWSRL